MAVVVSLVALSSRRFSCPVPLPSVEAVALQKSPSAKMGSGLKRNVDCDRWRNDAGGGSGGAAQMLAILVAAVVLIEPMPYERPSDRRSVSLNGEGWVVRHAPAASSEPQLGGGVMPMMTSASELAMKDRETADDDEVGEAETEVKELLL